jgi:hypothetical protein
VFVFRGACGIQSIAHYNSTSKPANTRLNAPDSVLKCVGEMVKRREKLNGLR